MSTSKSITSLVTGLINQAGRSPYLFIGSGFSRRYLDSEDWEGLLRYLCRQLTDDPFQFDRYVARAQDKDGYGKLPSVASQLDADLRLAVLDDERFDDYRNKHADEIRRQDSPLKILAAEHLSGLDVVGHQDELSALREAGKRRISGIITTNYDSLLEMIFPKYHVYVGQDDLLFSQTFELAEIYKIHGSVSDPQSMVLCEDDYHVMEETRDYLVAKLLTIFVEYPIIFIGYSISDPDIRGILKSIARCLKPENIELFRDRFIFLTRGENEVSTYSTSFESGGTIEMTKISTNDFGNVYRGISASQSSFSPRVLRQLRKSIYTLVEAEQPGGDRLFVQTGFDGLEELPEDKAFVVGVGTTSALAEGYGRLINAEELYEDVVLDNQYLLPRLVVEDYLPKLLRSNSGGLPMFKYLSVYDGEVSDPRIREQLAEKVSVDSFLNNALRMSRNSLRQKFEELSIACIIETEGDENAYKRLYCLNPDEIDLRDMHFYLRRLIQEGIVPLHNNSELKRIIRIYDYLKYKRTPDTSATSEPGSPVLSEGGQLSS